jgi:hypothetical protein
VPSSSRACRCCPIHRGGLWHGAVYDGGLWHGYVERVAQPAPAAQQLQVLPEFTVVNGYLVILYWSITFTVVDWD